MPEINTYIAQVSKYLSNYVMDNKKKKKTENIRQKNNLLKVFNEFCINNSTVLSINFGAA